MMAELFVYLGSFFAQLELNRFKTRVEDSHRKIRPTTRWAAGVPPLGFRVVDHPSGKGKGLDTDPDGHKLLHAMADKLLDGWSFVRITAWLNQTGAQTNKARARGKASTWTMATVIDALTSPRTQGLKLHKGETVLDAAGEPIRLAPATFDDDTWKQIQNAAALRKQNQRTPTESTNPILGVGFCGCTGCPACEHKPAKPGFCGRSLVQQLSGKGGRLYYRCGRKCPQVFIRADIAEAILEEVFIEHWCNSKVVRRVPIPGEDHSHELEKVEATITRLRRESDAGLLTTPEDERIWLERLKAQTARRDKLAAMPRRAAGWSTEETNQTYGEAWAEEGQDRRKLLVDAGVRLELNAKSARIKRPWFMDGPDEADYIEYDVRS